MYNEAAVGIVAYPSHGIYQSVRTLVKSGTRQQIMSARRQEGEYLVQNPNNVPIDVPFILSEFGQLCQKDSGRERPISRGDV